MFGAEPPVAILKFISPKLFIKSSRLFLDVIYKIDKLSYFLSMFKSYFIFSKFPDLILESLIFYYCKLISHETVPMGSSFCEVVGRLSFLESVKINGDRMPFLPSSIFLGSASWVLFCCCFC